MGTEVDNDAPVKPVNADLKERSTSSEQEDLKAASEATTDYSQFMPVLKPKKMWPRIVGWVMLIAILIAVVCGGGYWIVKRVQAANRAQAHKSTSTARTSNKTSSETDQYTSNDFSLSFTYPRSWVIADTGDGKLTLTSQPMPITNDNGVTESGVIVMDIENQGSADLSGFSTGSALAVLNSQLLDYTKPSGSQSADTYISFVQYNTATVKGTLDGIYVTGNFGYQKGQTIPESDINQIDPLIRILFMQCKGSKCTSLAAMRISAAMWSQPGFANPIENLLESLQFQ